MSQASSLPGQSAPWRFVFNTAVVMFGTILSRVLGLVRDAIISRQFGIEPEIGAYRAAFAIPDLLYFVIIGGALGSALVPVFSRLIEDRREDRAWELANTILTLAFACFVVIALLVGVFARPLLAVTVARGYAHNPELLDLAVRLMRIMLIQPLLLGLGGLIMALLQSFERFAFPAIAFNVYNLTIVIAALFFAPLYRVEALAWGVALGALLYVLVQLPAVFQAGLRFRPALNLRMHEVRRVGQLLAPRLLGQSALQINIIVMVTLIGLLSPSAQAANAYAYQLLMLPHGILAISLGTVMFPRLTRLFAAQQMDALRRASLQTLRMVLWLTLPAAIILAVLHVPILRLLFQRGEFDEQSLLLTGRALFFYTPGVIGLAGVEIVIRTFYAMENTRTPVQIGVLTIVLNGLLASFVITYVERDIGLVALSYSLANVLEFVLLFALLRRHLGGYSGPDLWRSVLALAASAAALFGALLLSVRVAKPYVPGITFDSSYGQGADFFWLAGGFALICGVGLGVYVAVAAVLRAPELGEIWALVRRRPVS